MFNDILHASRGLVTIFDNGKEKCMRNVLRNALTCENEKDLMELKFNKSLKHTKTLEVFLNECNALGNNSEDAAKLSVLLPAFSDFLSYQPASIIFPFLNTLQQNGNVKRILLHIAPQHLMHTHADYIIASLKYMADVVIDFETDSGLSVVVRKPGGGITKSCYNYTRNKENIAIQTQNTTVAETKAPIEQSVVQPEKQPSTFRIELDEDEMQTRNALALPFEKSDAGDKIIYVPNTADYDGEDPDEDLDI